MNSPQANLPDSTPVVLRNFLPEDFTFHWGGQPYHMKAGSSMRAPKWLAKHAAKHMADRFYDLDKGTWGRNRHAEDGFKAKMAEAIIEDGSAAPADTVSAEVAAMNAEPIAEPTFAEQITSNVVDVVVQKNVEPKSSEKKILCDECGTTGPRHKGKCPHATPPQAVR